MNFNDYLIQATKTLTQNSVSSARLDSLILLEFVLKVDRAKLLSNPDYPISEKQKNVLDGLIAKRSKHIPIAQLLKYSEFFGRKFYVNKHVLVPRPESEYIIEMVIDLVKNDPYLAKRLASPSENDKIRIVDIGTGSGALGITLKLELQNVYVDLSDIDEQALKVAKKNVVLYTTTISVINSNLFDNLNTAYDLIVANLPYVPDEHPINKAAKHEPKIAIFGGPDGLNIYRKFFLQISKLQKKPLYILIESFPDSHIKLQEIASNVEYINYDSRDYIQLLKYTPNGLNKLN